MECPHCSGTGRVPDEEDPMDDQDWPEGDYCPECGVPESHCVCDDPEYHCLSCGGVSLAIENGLCGMCYEMQGGVRFP